MPPGGTTQQGNPPDTAHVKHIKIQSHLLTEFWGQPMYIGANVLLPEGYDSRHSKHQHYPVIWRQTHFPFGNPFGFREDLSNAFSQFWVSKDAPKVIVVDIRHENPYFDDSYAVNSANLGPYGDAITQELMPAVDQRLPHHRQAVGEDDHRRLDGRLGDHRPAGLLPEALLGRLDLLPRPAGLPLPPARQHLRL